MKLPDYKGILGSTAWSGLKSLGPEDRRVLAAAALKGCERCRKAGCLERPDGLIEICHCVNRPDPKGGV